MHITELVDRAHAQAKLSGFWDLNSHSKIANGSPGARFRCTTCVPDIVTKLALIATEVGEAIEAHRTGDQPNFEEELADIVIRVADLAGALAIDLDQKIQKKIDLNADRPHKHGKRY